MDFITDYVKSVIPPGWKSNSTGWTSGNCPMCIHNGQVRADSRRRGGFYFDENGVTYNCFNCGFKAYYRYGQTQISYKFRNLLERGLNIDRAEVQRLNFRLLQNRTADQIFIEPKKPKVFQIDWLETELPENSKHISDITPDDLRSPDSYYTSIEHIVDRKLDYWNDWYYSPTLQFRSRIVLPFRYKDKVVGYIARWTKEDRKTDTPKYIVSKPQNFIFNLDNQKNNQYIILTEGPLDAIVTGGIALNGTSLSEEQAKIINGLRKKIIVLPDFDTAGNALVDIAVEQGWDVAFPDWAEDCKDANEAMLKYGRFFTVENVLDNIVTGSTKAKLLARKYCR